MVSSGNPSKELTNILKLFNSVIIYLPMAKATTYKALKLLTLGALAGPIYLFLTVFQMFIREGFDPTRHSWSLLSNGDLGWIHVMNFIVTGLLILAGASGIRMLLKNTPGGTWGPIFLALYGLGLIAGGIFKADPMGGFPPGSPEMGTITTNGILHLVGGSVGFLGLIIACFIFARRFFKLEEKNWAFFSLATGIIFFAAFFGIASASQPGSPFLVLVILTFTAAVILAWTWISLLSLKLMNYKTSK
jgi:hypothetical protein